MLCSHDRGSKIWLSTDDVARILDISTRTVERWRSEEKFVPDKRTSGGHSRYSRERVEEIKKKLKADDLEEHTPRKSVGRSPSSPKRVVKMKEKRKKKRLEIPLPILPFNIPSHEEFVKYVCGYLEAAGIKESTFGRKYLSDSGAISRLKNETTDPRLSTMIKICAGIEEIRKKGLQKMLQDMME